MNDTTTEINKDTFWGLIREAKDACGQDMSAMMEYLKERLVSMGTEQAQNFHDITQAYEDLACKYGLWDAAEIIKEYGCSDDGFIDFRAWLIAQGKEVYLAALADPDSLAEVEPYGDCSFEQMSYVGEYAYRQLTGKSTYLNGWSISEIAKDLSVRDVPTKCGKSTWTSTRVSYILSNERYIGDCKYQKTCREAVVPFRQSKNRGQEDMFYAKETHAPLLDKQLFYQVQELLEKKKKQHCTEIPPRQYPFTSRIRCSECGSFYHRKVRSGVIKWVCAKHAADTTACNSSYYSEERIYDGIITMINELRFCEEDILGQTIQKLEFAAAVYKRNNRAASQLSQSIAELNAKLLALERLRSKGYLAADIYHTQAREIRQQLGKLKTERYSSFESRIATMLDDVRKLKSLIDELEQPLETFDEKLFHEIVTDICINNRDEMTVTLLGDLKFTEQI